MTPISTCKINGIDAYSIKVDRNRVMADVGFLIDSNPFGTATMAGLDEDEEVRDAADALREAVEAAVAKRLGTPDESGSLMPSGLLDPSL